MEDEGILDGLGPAKKTYTEEEFVEKKETISPFDFIKDIKSNKKNLVVDAWSEKQYNPYVINMGLSFSRTTIIQANEMNSRPHLDNALQNQFLLNTIRTDKSYSKWLKKEKNEDVKVIMEYYGYSMDKAETVLPLLTDEQIKYMKNRLCKGGL